MEAPQSSVLSLLDPSSIASVWPKIAALLLRHKKSWEIYETLPSLQMQCMTQKLQVWARIDYTEHDADIRLLLLTSVIQHPSGYRELVLQYLMGKGLRESMEKDFPVIRDFVMRDGIDAITMETTPGIARMFRQASIATHSKLLLKIGVTPQYSQGRLH